MAKKAKKDGMRITIVDIAKLSGSSATAVSRILGNKPHRYSQDTVERVQRVARENGYRPNPYARSIRSGRMKAITILSGYQSQNSYFPHDLKLGISEALRAKGWQLNMAYINEDDAESVPNYLDELAKNWYSDGLLLNFSGGIPDYLDEFTRRHKLPWILLNCKQRRNAVYVDDLDAAQRAVEHLIKMGHRRISFLSQEINKDSHYSSVDRLEGYRKAMEQAGLKVDDWVATVRPALKGLTQVKEYLEKSRPTAVLCNGDRYSNWCGVAAFQMGWEVPKDLSIMSIDAEVSDALGVVPDYMYLPFAQMGQAAVEMLINKIEKGKSSVASKAFKASLEKLHACAPPQR